VIQGKVSLSPLTLAYAHSVLKSALEHAVREEEIPPQRRPQRPHGHAKAPAYFEPLTTEEAGAFLTATNGHRLSALFELALRTGLRKGNSSACAGKTSTWPAQPPASDAPSSAPIPVA
jgi:integrase